jgi:hypothetical protein
MTRLGNPACQNRRRREEGGVALWGTSGQGIKEAGFCWKLCTLAKARWKDQFGLYELVPSFFSGPDFLHL